MADQTQSNIVIHGSADDIMNVIADLDSYPEWTVGLDEVSVLEAEEDGRPRRVRMSGALGPVKDSYEIEYDWSKPGEVTWHLVKGSMVSKLDGRYAVTDLGDGSTRVDYSLAVDTAVPMIGLLKRRAEKVIMDSALKNLKKRVES